MKLFSNVFISFVGAGVLGLPYAFKEAGLLEAILVMTFISALWFVSSFVPLALPLIPVLSIKAMLLLVDCKNMIVSKTQNVCTSPYLDSPSAHAISENRHRRPARRRHRLRRPRKR